MYINKKVQIFPNFVDNYPDENTLVIITDEIILCFIFIFSYV